jgi:hypothetical protein
MVDYLATCRQCQQGVKYTGTAKERDAWAVEHEQTNQSHVVELSTDNDHDRP